MAPRLLAHLRSHVGGYLAIFLAVGGTAIAADGDLPGQNQVGSSDIINGEVTTADIGAQAVGSIEIRNGVVTGADVGDAALTGVDFAADSLQGEDVAGLTGADVDDLTLFKDNSLTGADFANTSTLGTQEIDEEGMIDPNTLDAGDVSDLSTLGAAEIDEASLVGVNAGRIDGIDSQDLATARSDAGGPDQCVGSLPSSSREICADVSLTPPHSGRALLIASGNWEKADAEPARSDCVLLVDGVESGPVLDMGDTDPDGGHRAETRALPFTLNFVTGVLSPTAHTFAFGCTDVADGNATDIDQQFISAVVVGSG